MTEASSQRQHWIADVLARAGVPNGDALRVPPDAPIEDAWQRAAEQSGLTTTEIASAVGRKYGLPVANLAAAENRALRLIPEPTARKYHVLPLRETDRQLVVATANPNDFDAEQSIAFAAGRNVSFEIAPPRALAAALDDNYSPNLVVEALLGRLDVAGGENVRLLEDPGDLVGAGELDHAPIVRLTNLIIEHAIRERASDVHIEPGPAGGHVRIRVDGVMQSALQMPMSLLIRVVSRIKILAKLDIADRYRPQDGRSRIQMGQKMYDLRVSTVPTRDAEKVVIRILDPSASPMLESLGIPRQELERLRQLITYREGIIIVTGPTGSGKSTTVYSLVRELSTGATNIMTVEDPVEYELPGITQIQVEPKRNVTFASALRAMLRQDPDVIYVGEIRDGETAEIAAQAAMTGHLVVASLHTNDAVGVVHRLRDLGLPAASIAAALRGVVGQRLVRKLCQHCAEPVGGKLTREEQMLADRHGVAPVRRPVGCKRCSSTGYRGRAAVAEVLTVTHAFADAVARGAPPGELDSLARSSDMRPLRKVGAELVHEGVTSIQELDRVVGSDAAGALVNHAAQDVPSVLVVDDDELTRTLARALLEKAGMKVTEAEDGEQALAILDRGEEFSLALLDLDMPKASGLEVLLAIRSRMATAGLPVIVLTGSETEADEVRVLEAGADDYVRKPIVPDLLLTRIRSVLRRVAAGP